MCLDRDIPADLLALAERVLGTRELADNWMTSPALALDGRRPVDLLTTAEGPEAVTLVLKRMEFGVYL